MSRPRRYPGRVLWMTYSVYAWRTDPSGPGGPAELGRYAGKPGREQALAHAQRYHQQTGVPTSVTVYAWASAPDTHQPVNYRTLARFPG